MRAPTCSCRPALGIGIRVRWWKRKYSDVANIVAHADSASANWATDTTSSAPVSSAIVWLDGRQVAITDASGNYTSPSWGVMTIEALSTTNGPPPLLEVEIIAGGEGPCCSERLENPTSIVVTAGTEVVAHVEMPSGSASQSFTLNTSMRRR